jgi:hypothetical protein
VVINILEEGEDTSPEDGVDIFLANIGPPTKPHSVTTQKIIKLLLVSMEEVIMRGSRTRIPGS